MNATALRAFLPAHVRNDKQLMALLDKLMCSNLEFGKCDEVPAHDIGVYGFNRVHRLQCTVNGKAAVILLGLP